MPTVHQVLPIDGVVIDTTVEPMTASVHIHGIKIEVPLSAEAHALLQARPAECRLLLELKAEPLPPPIATIPPKES